MCVCLLLYDTPHKAPLQRTLSSSTNSNCLTSHPPCLLWITTITISLLTTTRATTCILAKSSLPPCSLQPQELSLFPRGPSPKERCPVLPLAFDRWVLPLERVRPVLWTFARRRLWRRSRQTMLLWLVRVVAIGLAFILYLLVQLACIYDIIFTHASFSIGIIHTHTVHNTFYF